MRKQIRFKLALSDLNQIAKKIIEDINEAAGGQELNVEQCSSMLVRTTIFSNYHRHVGMGAKNFLKAVSFIPAVSLGAIFSLIPIYYGIKKSAIKNLLCRRREDANPRVDNIAEGSTNINNLAASVAGVMLGYPGYAVVVMANFALFPLISVPVAIPLTIATLLASPFGAAITGELVINLNAGDNIMKNTNTSITCLENLNPAPAQLDRLRKEQKEAWIKTLSQNLPTKIENDIFSKFEVRRQEMLGNDTIIIGSL